MTYSFAELLILGQVIPDTLPSEEDEGEDMEDKDLEEACDCPVQASGPALIFDDMELW